MNFSKIKAPVLWAAAFFWTLGMLSVGYSAYVSNYPATAAAGTSQLSAAEWNKMVTALQTLDNNLSAFTISSGNVGIGAAPAVKLDVSGSIRTQWGITWPSASNFHIDSTPGYGLYLNWSSGGDVYARTTPLASSDERLKKDIVTMSGSLKKIANIRGVTYYWKDANLSQRKQVWVVAQEVEKEFPDLVSTDKDGMMAVNYQGFVWPLVEAVKELKIENEKQSKEIEKLKAEIAKASTTP